MEDSENSKELEFGIFLAQYSGKKYFFKSRYDLFKDDGIISLDLCELVNTKDGDKIVPDFKPLSGLTYNTTTVLKPSPEICTQVPEDSPYAQLYIKSLRLYKAKYPDLVKSEQAEPESGLVLPKKNLILPG